ncbi:uncharacterized protein SCHCODRAFT_02075141 [Schizophyllum commune H4-8]|uniref:uncharacterized protein n=1 Tax=Schizophyllum commune (strain H4-8 / FGSC 9210) TaxID=578458 RepID=UPI00215E4C52|nr:uncharacterized protein SCHCODRAFT_02075141 [Schizophyllum commune H4-8]KAI5887920.1 hypothetical protein SCHCODRAFT_02075141 [Schizophyllum commune H4-8]
MFTAPRLEHTIPASAITLGAAADAYASQRFGSELCNYPSPLKEKTDRVLSSLAYSFYAERDASRPQLCISPRRTDMILGITTHFLVTACGYLSRPRIPGSGTTPNYLSTVTFNYVRPGSQPVDLLGTLFHG